MAQPSAGMRAPCVRGPCLHLHLLGLCTCARAYGTNLFGEVLHIPRRCSEASVLGEERHAHSCVVTSQSLVVLSVSTKDLRKCVHPADMATLREHFERRYSQRSSRLAVAASVAAMSASELARVRRGTGGGGNGGEESAAASLSGAAHVDSFGSRRSTLSGMAEATGSGANGVGGGEAARPGTPAAALDRLAAVMRGRVSCRAGAGLGVNGGRGHAPTACMADPLQGNTPTHILDTVPPPSPYCCASAVAAQHAGLQQ